MITKVAVIVPTFSHFDYAEETVRTAYAHTPECRVFVIDDHSPDWKESWATSLVKKFPTMRWFRFGKNGGLTRSWNRGLKWAREFKCPYAVTANSDLLFTPGWFEPLEWALNNGADLVGPLTNAPGHRPKQRVGRHIPDFVVKDDPDYLATCAAHLAVKNKELFTPMIINGFCMAAKTATWWAGAFDPANVFNPKYKITKNEDELQGRWKKAGRVSALVPASLVFHYRGVTRKGATIGREGQGWFRKKK